MKKSKIIKINVEKIIIGGFRVGKYAFGLTALLDLYCVIANLPQRTWRLLIADIVMWVFFNFLEFAQRDGWETK